MWKVDSNKPILSSIILHRMKSNQCENRRKLKDSRIVYKLLHQTNDSSNVVVHWDSVRIQIVIKRHLCNAKIGMQPIFVDTFNIWIDAQTKKRFFRFLFSSLCSENHWMKKKTETKKRKENVNSCGYPVSKFCFTFDLLVHWILNNNKKIPKNTCVWFMCVQASGACADGEFWVHNAQ